MMEVTRIAATRMDYYAALDSTNDEWSLNPDMDADEDDLGGSELAEFAGRACYQSWHKPNPDTATTRGYLANILHQQHFSVLEHGSVTYYVTGVSRSLTHELVRHRHFSYSQLSQRFVTVKPHDEASSGELPYVTPPLFAGHVTANAVLSAAWDYAVHAYERLIELGNTVVGDVEMVRDQSAAKAVREAARAVLPNMTPTAIVITGNHRAWREFLAKRATMHADAEIRRMAMMVYDDLMMYSSGVEAMYTDFVPMVNDNGDRWLVMEP